MYTNGSYFNKKRARVVIGTPMDPKEHFDPSRTQRENDEAFAAAMREKVLELRSLLDG